MIKRKRYATNFKTNKKQNIMKNLTINTALELREFVKENRTEMTSINGVELSEMYPMLSVTGKHASYYNVERQGNTTLRTPFQVTIK